MNSASRSLVDEHFSVLFIGLSVWSPLLTVFTIRSIGSFLHPFVINSMFKLKSYNDFFSIFVGIRCRTRQIESRDRWNYAICGEIIQISCFCVNN